jgi:hypothetical protein
MSSAGQEVQTPGRCAHHAPAEEAGKLGGSHMKTLAITIALALTPNMASAGYVLILKDSSLGIVKAGKSYRKHSGCFNAGWIWKQASRKHSFVCIPAR